jgi:GTP:adenosylcobinamide-phosphate guanylyltransferase
MTSPAYGNVACFIPARGGVQSIPRKNLLPVGGIPLVVRAITTMRRILPDVPIFVSTEDSEIHALSVEAGAEVIVRPTELASPSSDVKWTVKHACDQWAARGFHPDAVLHHEANVVVVDPAHATEILRIAQERPDISGIVPIVDVGCFKTYCRVDRTPDGCVSNDYLLTDKTGGNRQETPSEWHLTGGLCMFRPSNFVKWDDFGPSWYFGRRIYGLPTERWQAIHVDSHADLRWAEFCLRNQSECTLVHK